MKNLNIFSSVTEYENAKSGGVLNVPNISFVNEDISVRYLDVDPYNGHEYVDLGLPSGLKWATCNIGASSPEQVGLYFSWGETTGYTAKQVTSGVRAFNSASYKASSISTDLMLEQDAAHVNLGGNWRMPTKAEYQELIDNTTQTWTTDYNGTRVKGKVFTSKVNGNSVFFPLSGYCLNCSMNYVGEYGSYGYCWSASWESSIAAWFLYFHSGQEPGGMDDSRRRYVGIPVRGVCE